ncbi:MAG: D-arabinono-1,4-lactone oxidase [Parvibaculum sp.]
MARWTNWSGGVATDLQGVFSPGDELSLRHVFGTEEGPFRIAGSGHSFTPICETDGTILSLERLSGVLDVDTSTQRARVNAGTTIRDLGPLLHDAGLGLINQGDIDRQTIAGAVGTGTHGTGNELGSLSSTVQGFRMVMPDGEALTCSASGNADLFDAGRVSMGTLGVMSEIELQCRPKYALEEKGGRMALADLFSSLDELIRSNRHFEFFWFPFADEVLVKTLNEVEAEPKPRRRAPDGLVGEGDKAFRRLCEISRAAPFLRGRFQRRMTSQGGARYSGDEAGRVRWSHDAFPSDRNVRFNEMEYAVPAAQGAECVQELADYMRKEGGNFLFPIEYRTVAADDIWLSPFYQRDSVTISIHQYHKQSYERLFRGAEAIFRRYDGRPHWGKIHFLKARDFAEMYPKWDQFTALRRRVDPRGKLLSPYFQKIFGEG